MGGALGSGAPGGGVLEVGGLQMGAGEDFGGQEGEDPLPHPH